MGITTCLGVMVLKKVMPVDISFVFEDEKPAGKHGFCKARGDRFVFEDGTPVRFWGTNLNSGACFPEKDYAPKLAKRLAKIGINVGPEIRCIICETDFNHPFVQEELMMPILPIVRVDNIDQAIDLAVKAEHGNRHTAHMHSKNIDNLSRFAKAVETTIFVKNAPSYAGIGFGGEGHSTFTIAGPTGEGITSAKSFTRLRRCVMADHFRII